MPTPFFLLLATAALMLPTAVAAQEAPAQLPLPEPTPSASPTIAPSPVVTPTPAAAPRAEPTTAAPRPRVTPTPQPSPSATPTAAPTSPAILTPVPVPTVAPSPNAPGAIETVVLPQQRAAAPWWPWLAAAGGAALLAVAFVLRRRRGENDGDEPWTDEAAPPPLVDEPVLSPPPWSGRLALAMRPLRAGLNLISATAECEVTIVNAGELPVDDVRVALELMSAREGQGDGLATFFAKPIVHPAVAAFRLEPGEERRFRTVAALAHDAIHALEAGGRPMFVPLLALSAHYRADGVTRRVGQAFAVGVERVDSAKLGPFWLDTPPRLYDAVAARAHGPQVDA